MLKPQLIKYLLIILATGMPISLAEDKAVEAPRRGNVISILVTFDNIINGVKASDKENPNTTNKKVSK